MSTDRTEEIFNLLSGISREVGQFRKEMDVFRSETITRLDRLERELREHGKRFDRLKAIVLENRADVRDLEDRVDTIEAKP